MGLQIRDNISPALRKLAAGIRDRRPILEAMGLEMVSITKQSFTNAALRATPWPPKRDGSAATLYKHGALKRSIHIGAVTNNSVTVGTDRAYAAIHQLGGTTPPHTIIPVNALALYWPNARHPVKRVNHPGSRIPARPFFPFIGNSLAGFARTRIENVGRRALKIIFQQSQ